MVCKGKIVDEDEIYKEVKAELDDINKQLKSLQSAAIKKSVYIKETFDFCEKCNKHFYKKDKVCPYCKGA